MGLGSGVFWRVGSLSRKISTRVGSVREPRVQRSSAFTTWQAGSGFYCAWKGSQPWRETLSTAAPKRTMKAKPRARWLGAAPAQRWVAWRPSLPSSAPPAPRAPPLRRAATRRCCPQIQRLTPHPPAPCGCWPQTRSCPGPWCPPAARAARRLESDRGVGHRKGGKARSAACPTPDSFPPSTPPSPPSKHGPPRAISLSALSSQPPPCRGHAPNE